MALHATDADGDAVHFDLRSSGPLPTGNLQSDCTLTFTPTPAEVGTYPLTLVASDGAQQATQDVTLTVAADPVTTTRLSGVVQNAAGQPLAGVPVDIQDMLAMATTASDGSFLLDLGSGTVPSSVVVEVHGEQLSGPTAYPFVAAEQSVLFGHDLYSGVNNVIGRPIFLTPVDTAHEMTIDPSMAVTLTTPALPGASLQLAAGSVRNPNRSFYSGPLGLTEVSLDSTPVALPADVHPDLAVMIDPSRLLFARFGAVLTLPNRAGWPRGTSMQLWSLDPVTGWLHQVGFGNVSADGTTVSTTNVSGRTGSLYFFVPEPRALSSLADDPLNPLPGVPGRHAAVRFGSDADLYTGAVHTGHNLVTYQSQGAVRGLHLEYNSLWADPRPIVHFGFENLPPPDANDRLAARLTFTPGQQISTEGSGSGGVRHGGSGGAALLGFDAGTNYWLLPADGGEVETALQTDLTAQPSGVYAFTLATGVVRIVSGAVPNGLTGRLARGSIPVVSINAIDSPFGSGWGLAGLQQLVKNADDSMLLIDGSGAALLFQAPAMAGDPYVSPAGDFSTLVQLADSTFQRTLKDQTVFRFNLQRRLALMTDRNGNQTQYLYDANGRLTTTTDPVGLQTTFSYTGDRITGITDPAQRTTQLQYDAAGNLSAIIDPDQSARHFEYDARHHLTAEIDKRTNRDQDFYDFAGRATRSQRADGSVVQVAPAEVHGLFPADQTTSPFSPSLPTATAPTDAVIQIADPIGHVTTQTLDQRGQLTSSSDEIGSVGSVTRDANGFIVQSTNGLGNQTMFTYDDRGNVTSSQDSLSGPVQPQNDNFVGFSSFGNLAIVGTAVRDVLGIGAPDLIVATSDGRVRLLLPVLNGAGGKATGRFFFGPPPVELGASFRRQIALGDVNGDGKVDLVTSVPETGLFVKLGTGDGNGTFGEATHYDMGTSPAGLVVADFTGDGRAAVATADSTDSTVSVRLANPDGTLGPVATYDVGGPQGTLAVADVNGDGVPDLVTVATAGPSLVVLLGHKDSGTGGGDGTFAVGAPIPIPTAETGIAFGDLNEDSRVDLVVSGAVLPGNGDGTFTVVGRPEIAGRPTVADMDGDNHLDVMVPVGGIGQSGTGFILLYGKGDGTFGQQINVPVNSDEEFGASVTLLVSDLNADGRPDLVVGISPYVGSLETSVLLNNDLHRIGSVTVGQRGYTYDPTFNEPTSTTDELGRQKLYQIDPSNGDVLSSTIVVGDGAHNLVTQYTYFPDGRVKTITDPLGRVAAFTYDGRGRLTTSTAAQGTPDQAVTSFEYNAAGNITAVIDPDNHRTENHYDSMNRLTRLHDALGHDTLVTYDLSGNVLTTTDARGNVTANAYDAFSRLIQTTGSDPDGPGPLTAPVTTYTYDPAGNLIQVLDPLNHATQFAHDARKRVLSATDALGGVSRYAYDLDNNRTNITDPDGNSTRFAYDVRDRLVSETDPLRHALTWQYDPVNHLVSRTDRDGRTISYTFNELDEPVTETWTGAGGSTDNVIHSGYDDDGNLLTAADTFSALAYTYTNRNQVTTVDSDGTPGAPHVVLAYTYDPAGNVLSLADTINGQADLTNAYTPDALNRVAEVTQSGPGVHDKRVDITYNEVGQFATIDRFADLGGTQAVVRSASTYDGLNRLTGLVHSHAGSPLASYQYAFDAGSRLTQVVSNDGTTNYSHDALDQLQGADHHDPANPAESYTYDANGNRVTSSLHGSGYQTGPGNRLLADGTFTYTYDNEGNLVQRTETATGRVRQFQWDERNRLTAVTDKDAAGNVTQQVLFTYDAFNRRIAREVQQGGTDVVTYFVQDRGNPLLDFVDDDGPAGPHAPVVAMRYLSGPAVDQVFAQEDAAGNVSWLLGDHIGTVRDLVDNSGAVLNHITYDSFGNVIAQTHPAVTTRFLFVGREFDPETGLYYYRARYYDPKLGRFISEDPIGFAAGANFYRYAHNSPLSRTDPLGQNDGDGLEDLLVDSTDFGILEEPEEFFFGPNPLLDRTLTDAEYEFGFTGHPETAKFSGEGPLTPGNTEEFQGYLDKFGQEEPTFVGEIKHDLEQSLSQLPNQAAETVQAEEALAAEIPALAQATEAAAAEAPALVEAAEADLPDLVNGFLAFVTFIGFFFGG